MNYTAIYGIGLPRTGTTSLAAYLFELGVSSEHRCMLTGGTPNVANLDAVAVIDNSLYQRYEELLAESNSSGFILTIRNSEAWTRSVRRFSNHEGLPNMLEFHRDVIKTFSDAGAMDRLLILDIFEDKDVAEKIIKFIGASGDKSAGFPCLNGRKRR